METINKSLEMQSGVDRIWEILTATDEESKYWTYVKDIKVLSTDGNTIEREATVGPNPFSQRSRQTIVLDPKNSIKLELKGETIVGNRTIVLVSTGKNSTKVDVQWRFEMKDVPGFVQGIVKNQFSRVTEKALAKIAEDAERAAIQKGA